MTVLEQRFMESVIISLRDIALNLRGINDSLKDIKEHLNDTAGTDNA